MLMLLAFENGWGDKGLKRSFKWFCGWENNNNNNNKTHTKKQTWNLMRIMQNTLFRWDLIGNRSGDHTAAECMCHPACVLGSEHQELSGIPPVPLPGKGAAGGPCQGGLLHSVTAAETQKNPEMKPKDHHNLKSVGWFSELGLLSFGTDKTVLHSAVNMDLLVS